MKIFQPLKRNFLYQKIIGCSMPPHQSLNDQCPTQLFAQYSNNHNTGVYKPTHCNSQNKYRKKFNENFKVSAHFPCVAREVREKWLVNLTDEFIPDDVLDIAALGKKFGISIVNNRMIPIEKIVAAVESNLDEMTESQRNSARTVCVDTITNFLNNKRKPKYPELDRKVRETRKFKSNHPDIMFLKADKGNVTVAVHRDFYISKMSTLLSDKSTYRVIKEDPTSSIENQVNKTVIRWFKRDFITEEEKHRLLSRNGNIALSYGLPKIHKENVPFRMIVSFIGTPTYHLAKYLQKILADCLKEETNHLSLNKVPITNSISLVKKIRSLNLPEDFAMISMDAVSLFTNIPLPLVIIGIKRRWSRISQHTKISQKEFIEAIKLCVRASAFQFNGVKYQQVFGTAMGSPLSPIVAEIVLQDLENCCLRVLDFPVYFYTRYVDDILVFLRKNTVNSILSCFNAYHQRLQFTLEVEKNQRMSFLEVSLIREKGKIGVDWYRKPTSSGRYLNYYSHHPKCQKIGTIYNLVDRAVLLSDRKYHLKNLAYIRQSLVSNGYPKNLVKNTIMRREHYLIQPNIYYSSDIRTQKLNKTRTVTIPYVEHLSETLRANLRQFQLRLAFRNDSNLRWLFGGGKDKLPVSRKTNTVYKISCLECNFIFIDHTKQQLGVRVREHYLSLRQPHVVQVTNQLTEHAFCYRHDFNFSAVEILGVEANYKRRELLALIFRQQEFLPADESVEKIRNVSKIYADLFHQNY